MERGHDGITVGIDIGTTSVKALAVDGDGTVLARARVPHAVESPAADLFQHDADKAWRRNVRTAFRRVSGGLDIRGVNVAAMVPSLVCRRSSRATDDARAAYGDARGGAVSGEDTGRERRVVSFLHWCAQQAPDAAGFWPAQAVANHALTGIGALDTVDGNDHAAAVRLHGVGREIAADAGATVESAARIVSGNDAVGTPSTAMVVGGGTIDALAEQLVAGAERRRRRAGDPRHHPDHLGRDPRVARDARAVDDPAHGAGQDPDRRGQQRRRPVPQLGPRLRGQGRRRRTRRSCGGARCGCRTSGASARRCTTPSLRASLHDLDLTHGPAGGAPGRLRGLRPSWRATTSSCGGVPAQRIVATGGGARVDAWVQALADCTGLPVDVVAVPEGGALGAAFMARVVAGSRALDGRRGAMGAHRSASRAG